MAGLINEHRVGSYQQQALEVIGTNSLVIESGDAIRIASGFATKTVTGERINGISKTLRTFPAANQTVDKLTVNYKSNSGQTDETYIVPVTGGVLVQTDVGSFFSMGGADQSLDAATVSATVGVYLVVNVGANGLTAEVSLTQQGS